MELSEEYIHRFKKLSSINEDENIGDVESLLNNIGDEVIGDLEGEIDENTPLFMATTTIATILSTPQMVGMIGNLLEKAGKKTNNKYLTKISDILVKWGNKVHMSYIKKNSFCYEY